VKLGAAFFALLATLIPAPVMFFAALVPGTARAFSDGPPWTVEADGGCIRCHFDSAAVAPSPVLRLAGIPPRIAAGKLYQLIITLRPRPEDLNLIEEMRRAGFFLSAKSGDAPAGTFEVKAIQESVEVQGALARSTKVGSALLVPNDARWAVFWRAPDGVSAPVTFNLWAVAANGDDSRFGDVVHISTNVVGE